ncbi:hypothetical protein CKO15_13085 [Halorhodospira abdelmalekii]|uniref:hypothetical protein n=1 Tax=Halorhodospira abdelmalekii TaxID=421629 RepID=UPI0019084898|nr:hypothetical protein [Halorhodospira abdelmalekii]MBK1736186.1 hypothetical protein [Halorhodospira abdelmalekii]
MTEANQTRLTIFNIMLVDSMNDELRQNDDSISIEGRTVGGKRVAIYTLIDDKEDQENPSLIFLSKVDQVHADIHTEPVLIRPWTLKKTDFWAQDDDHQGFWDLFFEAVKELIVESDLDNSDRFHESLDVIIDVFDEVLSEGREKLYRRQHPCWGISQLAVTSPDLIGIEDPEDLIGTLVIEYTPAVLEYGDYVINTDNIEFPVLEKDSEDPPELHDEIDTSFVYLPRDHGS